MPELTPVDVEKYTGGRLDRDDPETERLLNLALRAARRRCGWHVYPTRADTLNLDGPGGRLLALPTLRLVELTEVVEDGTTLDVAALEISRRGMVRKAAGSYWTERFGGLVVKMTHGFSDTDGAEDFQGAVLSIVDRASFAPAGGRARVIGPFQYDIEKAAGGWTEQERAWLDPFRLERPA